MPAAIALRYEDDTENPIATVTAVHVQASGLDVYDADPTEDDASHTVDDKYYIQVREGADEVGRSHIFTPSADGDHEWDGYVFPSDGSFTVRVMKIGEESDTEAATTSVTVDAAE